MNKYSAYIDESGDPHFNTGCSSSFFVCATITKDEDINTICEAIKNITKKYDLHELKSSRISSEKRRSEILRDIAELPIMIFTIIVKKEKLNGDWFRYRRTFFKYVVGKLVSQLDRVFGNLDISFDKYGSEAFQESFKKYIQVKLQTEMFASQIIISSAKINPIIQISDIVAGSIRKYYDSEYSDAEMILTKIWKGKDLIPNETIYSSAIEATDEEDREIANTALASVDRYISTYSKEPTKITHCQVAEFLKLMAFEEPKKFCHRNEIITWLNFLSIEISEENLSRTIISELRDDGVLLASSDDGIKIPTSLSEIEKHYRFILGQSMPQLKRLKKMDQVLIARIPKKHDEFMKGIGGDIKEVLAKLHS